LTQGIDHIAAAARARDKDGVIRGLTQLVPDYAPSTAPTVPTLKTTN
jgi:hypothetical protein